jgi:colanic acid biosynthesis glycosyl transferase WcaI
MRVVFVNRYFHPDHSATSRMVSDLAFSLAGHDVHVVTSRQRYGDAASDLPAAEEFRSVVVHRVPTTRFGRRRLAGRFLDYASFYVTASLALLRLARGGVVVACTDPPMFSVCAAIACRLTWARLINWLHDLFPEVAAGVGVIRAGGLPDRALRRWRDWSLSAAALNVVPGGRMAQYLRERGVESTAIRVIPNWADGDRIRPVPREANALRRRWGLSDAMVVGYSGNMGRAHEFSTLLEAATLLRHRTDIRFLLIGDGHHRPWIEAEARRRGLENVMLQPLQDDTLLADSLGTADAHLVSLRPELEGFVVPSKFYAAAAAGRPVLAVGDRDGEIARLVMANACGASVPHGDGPALAREIARLADDPGLCRALGGRARHAFETRFHPQAATTAWVDLLATMAGPPSADRRPSPALAAIDG